MERYMKMRNSIAFIYIICYGINNNKIFASLFFDEDRGAKTISRQF